ncbi:Gfo/Idh/MocA family oxidoreductase [Paenibacillus sp. IB182496]|uniref:Gfo/Idh/MocA family oxidoreductase n=1 Tax=Paenibacillus sabuli TaxID=2772509 RepID=A0A927BV81_9BACL|nr:Gfo/Idh/MocA family oxidoreductase [Paenibacillus sabuli]MBD2847453.1 Gfo/Idh/MocA family oxidoreductase [Paenibacillus sabuli]
MDTKWLDLDYKPALPEDKSRGIAIVGAGEIVESCHLPAYRMAGLRVVGLYDLNADRARELADKFEIGRVYGTMEELLADEDVQVVDLAVPAKVQPTIVEQVAAAGKHMLCQKPLAESYEEALRIVRTCEAAGVKAAVNQQMRWSPGIRASHTIIRRGWLGELLQANIAVNVKQEFANWKWLREIETLEFMYHSIHYMDTIRYLYGEPEYIYADGARFPGQQCKGETRTLLHIRFPGEARGLIHDNHNHIGSEDDWYATFRFEGTEGIIKGTNGSLYNYPVGREDTLSYYSKRIDASQWFTPQLEGKWFPHAFMGTMGELMLAIEQDREPANSVRDNLGTMKMVFGAYASMTDNRPVYMSEMEEA